MPGLHLPRFTDNRVHVDAAVHAAHPVFVGIGRVNHHQIAIFPAVASIVDQHTAVCRATMIAHELVEHALELLLGQIGVDAGVEAEQIEPVGHHAHLVHWPLERRPAIGGIVAVADQQGKRTAVHVR